MPAEEQLWLPMYLPEAEPVKHGRLLLPAGFAALLLHLEDNMVYYICNLILAI